MVDSARRANAVIEHSDRLFFVAPRRSFLCSAGRKARLVGFPAITGLGGMKRDWYHDRHAFRFFLMMYCVICDTFFLKKLSAFEIIHTSV